jgi:hypothetical protein
MTRTGRSQFGNTSQVRRPLLRRGDRLRGPQTGLCSRLTSRGKPRSPHCRLRPRAKAVVSARGGRTLAPDEHRACESERRSRPLVAEAVAQTTLGSGASICDGTTHAGSGRKSQANGTRPSPELRIAIRLPPLRFLSFLDPFVQQPPREAEAQPHGRRRYCSPAPTGYLSGEDVRCRRGRGRPLEGRRALGRRRRGAPRGAGRASIRCWEPG